LYLILTSRRREIFIIFERFSLWKVGILGFIEIDKFHLDNLKISKIKEGNNWLDVKQDEYNFEKNSWINEIW
jgi:hypothetical protein